MVQNSFDSNIYLVNGFLKKYLISTFRIVRLLVRTWISSFL